MKAMLLVSAAALAFSGSAYAAGNHMHAAGAHGTPAARAIHAAPKGSTTLYDQNIGDNSYGVFSNTLSSYPQYDEYLADDFIVPNGHTWKVTEVDTTGFYYIGSGPAQSVNVIIWADKKGLPNSKKMIADCENLKYKDSSPGGSFQIKLGKKCKVSLDGSGKKGTRYWVTVQANMGAPLTLWAWQENLTVNNNGAAGWYYGGGNSVDPSCLKKFGDEGTCLGEGAGTVDVAFALQGQDSGK